MITDDVVVANPSVLADRCRGTLDRKAEKEER